MYMPNGAIATTEYSASTGGYTSGPGQTSPFTPVPDAGDAVCVTGACNPNHSWTRQVTAAAIQGQWPQIGTFSRVGPVTTDTGRPGAELGPGQLDHRVRRQRLHAGDGPGVRRRPRAEVGLLHVTGHKLVGRQRDGPRLGPRHRHGSVGRPRLCHRAGHRSGQLDATSRSSGTTTPRRLSGTSPVRRHRWGRAAGSGATGWLPPTAASSPSATPTFYGSMGGQPLNEPVVGMAATPDDGGYWEVASDGGIFSLRGRPFLGLDGRPATEPAHGGHGRHPRWRAGTGRWPPTAASSPSATPLSTARWAASR